MADDVDEHSDDDVPCYRHPDRLTALSCSSCERPICTECAVTAAVGIKCPECAQQSRTARAAVPRTRLAAGMVAALAVALVGGTLLAVVRIPFLGIILAYALGALVGATARRASGGFRDDALTRVATIAAAVGVLALPGTWIVQTLARGGSVDAVSVAFVLIAAVAAAFGAVRGSQ